MTTTEVDGHQVDAVCVNHHGILMTMLRSRTMGTWCMTQLNSQTQIMKHHLLEKHGIPHLVVQ